MMQDFATVIYEKFFMRDLLGKFAPGLILLVAVSRALGFSSYDLPTNDQWVWLFWIAAIPVSLLSGLTLQTVGELVGLHWGTTYPQRFLLLSPGGSILRRFCSRLGCQKFLNNWKLALDDRRLRLAKFKGAPGEILGDDAKSQRERLVYLREGSGNLGLAVLVLTLSLAIEPPYNHSGLSTNLGLIVVGVLLLVTHALHTKRQATFEIGALKDANLLDPNEAKDMEGRLLKFLF